MHQMKLENVSPIWVSPEVLNADKVTEMVDIYSLGVIMWEIFSGDIPYAEVDSRSIPYMVVVQGFRPSLEAVIKESTQIGLLISECWAADPKNRPHAITILATLREILINLEEVEALRKKEIENKSLQIANVYNTPMKK